MASHPLKLSFVVTTRFVFISIPLKLILVRIVSLACISKQFFGLIQQNDLSDINVTSKTINKVKFKYIKVC